MGLTVQGDCRKLRAQKQQHTRLGLAGGDAGSPCKVDLQVILSGERQHTHERYLPVGAHMPTAR